MNRQEYISELKNALNNFDRTVSDEIIADYEEHFDIGASEGKSEDQICLELGSISELIDDLRQMEGSENSTAADNKKSIENSEQKEEPEPKKEETEDDASFKTFYQEPYEQQTAGTNGYYYNQGDVQSKSTGSNTDNTEKSGYTDNISGNKEDRTIEKCTKVYVEALSADVRIKKSENGRLNFRYDNHGSTNQKMAYSFEHYQQGDTLYAKIVRRDVNASWFFNRISTPYISLDIELPDNLQQFTVKGTEGDFSIENISAADIDICSYSGDIHAERICSQYLKLRSTSGDIKTRSITTNESMDVTSTSGDFELINCSSKRLFANSMSGEIEIRNCSIDNGRIKTISGDFDIEGSKLLNTEITTMSGDISLKNVEGNTISADTKSGDVSLTARMNDVSLKSISGDVRAYINGETRMSLNSVSGEINCTLINSTGYRANASSLSGDIRMYYGKEMHSIRSNEVIFGSGASSIFAKTVSGDVRING